MANLPRVALILTGGTIDSVGRTVSTSLGTSKRASA